MMKNSSMGWDKERLTMMTLKYMQGELSVEEQAELDLWLADPINRERFEARISEENLTRGAAVWQAALESKEQAKARIVWGRRIYPWRRMAIAAAVLVVFLAGGASLLFSGKGNVPTKPTAKQGVSDLPPGSNRAILILADGSKMALDTVQNGVIGRQGACIVNKVDTGTLTYENMQVSGPVSYNSIVTPRGGQYKAVLPDGTKVWLNAASSIHFPTSFAGATRDVEVTGEAYFEVRHLADFPFRVHARGLLIEDIGTHFNVNAYTDEPTIKTTLEEGSVKMNALILSKPGEQALFEPISGRTSLQKGVDLEQALAWKEGMFEFENADLGTVLRTLARWYDFDVVYKGNKDALHSFTGQFSREVSVSGNLKILEETGYHLELAGRTITVLP